MCSADFTGISVLTSAKSFVFEYPAISQNSVLSNLKPSNSTWLFKDLKDELQF